VPGVKHKPVMVHVVMGGSLLQGDPFSPFIGGRLCASSGAVVWWAIAWPVITVSVHAECSDFGVIGMAAVCSGGFYQLGQVSSPQLASFGNVSSLRLS